MSTENERSLGERVRAPFEGPNTVGHSNGFWIVVALGVLLLALYPVLFGVYNAGTWTRFLVYALLGVSLCFIWGFCGILSFGQVAFFGVGGYTFGVVAINVTSYTGATLGIVTAVAVAALSAAALGYFMFYGGVRDVYVTIITLLVAVVLERFMAQTAGSEWAVGEAALGGFNGMVGIPDLAVGVGDVGYEFGTAGHYYLVLVTLVGTVLGLRALLNSQFGFAMIATREDEARTEMFGYDTTFIKFVAFTIGGALAGLSGVLFVTSRNYIDPDEFALTAAAMPVIWASIGGRKSIVGTIAAAILLQWFHLRLTGEWAFVIMGSLLAMIVLLLPGGVAPGIRDLVGYVRERRRGESHDSPVTTEEVSD